MTRLFSILFWLVSLVIVSYVLVTAVTLSNVPEEPWIAEVWRA